MASHFVSNQAAPDAASAAGGGGHREIYETTMIEDERIQNGVPYVPIITLEEFQQITGCCYLLTPGCGSEEERYTDEEQFRLIKILMLQKRAILRDREELSSLLCSYQLCVIFDQRLEAIDATLSCHDPSDLVAVENALSYEGYGGVQGAKK